ncbi:MAG: hypothetical protein ACLQVA_16410 [Candidatus Brocadiia bacterium]
MATHNDKPQRNNSPPSADLLGMVKRILSSDYPGFDELRSKVVGKTVVDSRAGRSGYLLYLHDGSWVLCFLQANRLEWVFGSCEPAPAQIELLDSREYGDGRLPLTYDFPYASQECNLAAEVAKSRGATIEGFAIGENTFNITFPDGHEIDATIVMDRDGKVALRVFWEQW